PAAGRSAGRGPGRRPAVCQGAVMSAVRPRRKGVGSAATLAPRRTSPPQRGQVGRKPDVSAGGWTGGRYGGRGGGAGPGRRRSSSGRRARPPAHIGVTIGGGRPMGARGCEIGRA